MDANGGEAGGGCGNQIGLDPDDDGGKEEVPDEV